MTQDYRHPITPPPELIEEWCEQLFGCPDKPEIAAYELVRLGAQWGADQELEACCALLDKFNDGFWCKELRAARRPKPPSLKQRALEAMHRNWNPHNNDDFATISRALEQLDD